MRTERRQAMSEASLITVIGRVIIQSGRRLTDWSMNELTRRGPGRELESSGRPCETCRRRGYCSRCPWLETAHTAGLSYSACHPLRSTAMHRSSDCADVFSLVAMQNARCLWCRRQNCHYLLWLVTARRSTMWARLSALCQLLAVLMLQCFLLLSCWNALKCLQYDLHRNGNCTKKTIGEQWTQEKPKKT